MLRYQQQQVLPIGSDRVAIGPARTTWLERPIVPAQDFQSRWLTDATTADRVDDLTTAEEQIPNLATRADTNHTLASRKTFHLHEVRQARAMKARAKPAFAHRARKLLTTIHRCHGRSRSGRPLFVFNGR
jgi:hypothetical protein